MENGKEASLKRRTVTLHAGETITFSEKDGDIVWNSKTKAYRLVPAIRTDLTDWSKVILAFNAEDDPPAD